MIEKHRKKECVVCHKKQNIQIGYEECKSCRKYIEESNKLADEIQNEILNRFRRDRFTGGGVDPNTNYKQPYKDRR